MTNNMVNVTHFMKNFHFVLFLAALVVMTFYYNLVFLGMKHTHKTMMQNGDEIVDILYCIVPLINLTGIKCVLILVHHGIYSKS